MNITTKNENSLQKVRKGRRKTIRLRDGESIMEGNTVQLPFIVPYRGEPITALEYTWKVNENGVDVTRGIEISGHGRLGIPTLRDKEVLRALQDIYIQSKVKDGVLNLETNEKNIREEDLVINYISIDNIAKAMGYKSISGQQRKNIKDSINRLIATTVFSTQSGGVYNVMNKAYVTDSQITFRYLEEMKSISIHTCKDCEYLTNCGENIEKCLKSHSKTKSDKPTEIIQIKMSKFMYLSIANNYRLYYDRDRTNEIQNLLAKNIYLISRKWIGDGYVSIANIQKYIDRLPINASELKHRKQKIRNAVAILNKYNFVEASIDKDIITIKHLDKKLNILEQTDKKVTDMVEAYIEATTGTNYMQDRFNTYSDFSNTLRDQLRFEDSDFDKYIDLEKITHLKAMLRATLIKAKYDKALDVRRYYINWINKCKRTNYDNIDSKYYTNA